MAMPRDYEKNDDTDFIEGGFITKSSENSNTIDNNLKKIPEIKTPKKTRKIVKVVWVLFWVSLFTTQLTAGLLMIDFENHILFSVVNLPPPDTPKELLDLFPPIAFILLMPAWYFSIKYRHRRKTLLLMFVLIVPTLIVNLSVVALGLSVLLYIAVLIVGIIIISPIGRKITFGFYRFFFKRGKNNEPNWSWERD